MGSCKEEQQTQGIGPGGAKAFGGRAGRARAEEAEEAEEAEKREAGGGREEEGWEGGMDFWPVAHETPFSDGRDWMEGLLPPGEEPAGTYSRYVQQVNLGTHRACPAPGTHTPRGPEGVSVSEGTPFSGTHPCLAHRLPTPGCCQAPTLPLPSPLLVSVSEGTYVSTCLSLPASPGLSVATGSCAPPCQGT